MTRKEQQAIRDAEIVELIHKNTLRILEEIGIAFLSEHALELLRTPGWAEELSQLLQAFYGGVDLMVVGQYSSTASVTENRLLFFIPITSPVL